RGRLSEVSEYENIIIRATEQGVIVRLKDVARVELGAQSYETFGRVAGEPAAMIIVYLQTGANALNTMRGVIDTLQAAEPAFPAGVHYSVSHDTTQIVNESIV